MRGPSREFAGKCLKTLVNEIEENGNVFQILSMTCKRNSDGIWNVFVEYDPTDPDS